MTSAVIKNFRGEWAMLSNFSFTKFSWHGHNYPTAEHAFQCAKTLDLNMQKTIRSLVMPGMAKNIGRKAPLRPGWEQIKRGIMDDIVLAKFAEPGPQKILLSTNDDTLVEGNNWHDVVWGVCWCNTCGGVGSNWLGESLMKARSIYTSKVTTSASC